MTWTVTETIAARLGSQMQTTITYEEFEDLQAENQDGNDLCAAYIEEINALESVKKQLDMAREIIDGIVECIDDEGNVEPADKKHLVKRIKAAVKFVGNL